MAVNAPELELKVRLVPLLGGKLPVAAVVNKTLHEVSLDSSAIVTLDTFSPGLMGLPSPSVLPVSSPEPRRIPSLEPRRLPSEPSGMPSLEPCGMPPSMALGLTITPPSGLGLDSGPWGTPLGLLALGFCCKDNTYCLLYISQLPKALPGKSFV